jgi:hypothetical protein
LLLAKAGVITLKDPTNILSTVKDIAQNPKDLKIRELEAATIPRVLTQVDLALINTNYALEAKLDPSKDALVIEGNDSPYVNILVSRADNKDSDAMKKLAAALHSPEVNREVQRRGIAGVLIQECCNEKGTPRASPFLCLVFGFGTVVKLPLTPALSRGRGGRSSSFSSLSSTHNCRSAQLEQTPRSVPSPSGRGLG